MKTGLIRAAILWAGVAAVVACGCKESGQATERRADPHAGHNHAPGEGHGGEADEHAGHDHGANGAHADGERVAAEAWCFEHDVPETVCTRCNPALIDDFKAKGDWCAGHGLPESQCLLCNPEFEAKYAAMRPKGAGDQGSGVAEDGIRVERAGSLRPANDPRCHVEDNLVRFIDRTIVGKAGIEVTPVRQRRMSAAVESPAEVRYDRNRLARITPRSGGIVVEVTADLGERVEAGQVLAMVDSPTMGEAKAAYIDALQRRDLARADFDRHDAIHQGIDLMMEACETHEPASSLRAKYAEVRIGDYKSRLLNAHSELELARTEYEREESLAGQGVSSQQTLERARRDLAQAEADFAATHEAIEIEMEKEHLALERALRVAEVALDAARRRLEILGVGGEEIASLDAGKDTALSRYAVRSPMAGRIVEREAVVGEMVETADTLFEVADTSTMWLLLSLRERDLATVREGDPVRLALDGLPGRMFNAEIDWISSAVEEPSRVVPARAVLENGSGLLRANMFGRAEVIVHDNDEVVAAPVSAVQTDGCCNLVFVQESPTSFRPRKVVLGTESGGMVEILEGLSGDTPVVTAGTFLLKTELLKANIGAGCCEVEPGR